MEVNATYVLLPVLFAVATYTEIKCRRIPNFLTLSALFLGVCFSAILGGVDALKLSLIGAAVGGGVLLPFCLLGVVGGGDMKLMAAVGSIVGWPLIFGVLYFSSLIGGVMALIIIIWHNQLLTGITKSIKLFFGVKGKESSKGLKKGLLLPFGLAIALGTVIAIVRQ